MLLLACTSASIVLQQPAATETTPEDVPVTTVPEDTAPERPTGDLYAPDQVWPLELQVDAASWNELRVDGHDFVDAELIYEGWDWPVQIHIKGSSTWQDITAKPSLVVDVNGRVPGLDFMGVSKFYLHNQAYDPSMFSETLSYGFYREWGYPASRTSFARLTMNGQDYGFYTVVEPHEQSFLDAWFADPNGNLYENRDAYCDVWDVSCMEVEQSDEGSDEALKRLGAAAKNGDFATVWSLVNQDRFVDYLALEAAISHWDSYSYDLSNFQLYHEPSSDQWTLLTQSMDLDYGWRPWSYPNCGQYAMDPGKYTMGALASECQKDATCHAAFVAAIAKFADKLEAADGGARVRALDAWVGSEVQSDSRRYYDNSDYREHIACLQTFFEERPGQLRDWVATQ